MEIKFVERGTGTYCVHQDDTHVAALTYLGDRKWVLGYGDTKIEFEANTAEDAQQYVRSYLRETEVDFHEVAGEARDKDFEMLVDAQLNAIGTFVNAKNTSYIMVYASSLVRELAAILVGSTKEGMLEGARQETIRLLDQNIKVCQQRLEHAEKERKQLADAMTDVLLRAAGNQPGSKPN
jgi:hypothetical protein